MARVKMAAALTFGAALASGVLLAPIKAQTVPTDPQPLCAIAPGAFKAMFDTGTVTLNGVVKPADSTVNLTPNCPFFIWSEQMFLWMTSPAPTRYGGGSRIMFSPSFFTVTPQFDSGGGVMRRSFIPNVPGRPIQMMLRATELGPHMLPVLLARTGQVVEVQRVNPNAPVPPVVRAPSGALIRLSDVRRAPNTGELQFFGPSGAPVQVRKLALPSVQRPAARLTANGRLVPVVPVAALQGAIQARKFVLRGIPIFVDAKNNVIDVEPGQADGGVLLSQNGSLIYYVTVVNDVFAYHRTMQIPGVIPFGTSLTFPLTAAAGNAVKVFAAAHGHTIVDPQALAIESKSSWVVASAVPNPADYIQVDATVPTFDKSNPSVWVPNGKATIKLVMVGMHVVGSTFGHGEMVWSSFEHLGNAPNAPYSYRTNAPGNPVKNVPQNTVGAWLFTPSGAGAPFNAMRASWDESTGHIIGLPSGSPVAPTPVLRMRPWGSDGSNTLFNTQMVSANATVIGQLAPGDVRAKYFQLGSTWTAGGVPPAPGTEVGTNQLANATIETFVQASQPVGGPAGTNCFACHNTNKVAVSHIYRELKPLF